MTAPGVGESDALTRNHVEIGLTAGDRVQRFFLDRLSFAFHFSFTSS
jgi:hypothetical protein